MNKEFKNNFRRVFTHPIYFLAFGFGSGLSPVAPGTFGTLAAIPIYFILQHYCSALFYFLITLFATIAGIYICDLPTKQMGMHDYPGIVWDEIVGFLWLMIAVPFRWYWLVLAFLLFRLFDIWKPWPIKWLDKKIMGGLGIMLDDWVAAGYSWICLQLIIYYFSR